MTQLEELKAAYGAATKGEWDFVVADNAEVPHSIVVNGDGEELLAHVDGTSSQAQSDVHFCAVAKTFMPQLLEAVERLEAMQRVIGELASTNPFLVGEFEKNKTVLEKLK